MHFKNNHLFKSFVLKPLACFAIGLVALFSFFSPENAYAYLNPTTSSYILQIILGFGLGVIFSIKLCYRRIKAYFKHSSPKK